MREPAFPLVVAFAAGSYDAIRGEQLSPNHGAQHVFPGMTLRDYFAAKAMAAYMVSAPTAKTATDNAHACAEWAYIQADAMLKERNK